MEFSLVSGVTKETVMGALAVGGVVLGAHDFSKSPVTWNREISRIVYARGAPVTGTAAQPFR